MGWNECVSRYTFSPKFLGKESNFISSNFGGWQLSLNSSHIFLIIEDSIFKSLSASSSFHLFLWVYSIFLFYKDILIALRTQPEKPRIISSSQDLNYICKVLFFFFFFWTCVSPQVPHFKTWVSLRDNFFGLSDCI